MNPHVKAWLAIGVAAFLVLGVASWVDPLLNVPVVSHVTCVVKGGMWWPGGEVLWIYAPPGCYTPSVTP